MLPYDSTTLYNIPLKGKLIIRNMSAVNCIKLYIIKSARIK